MSESSRMARSLSVFVFVTAFFAANPSFAAGSCASDSMWSETSKKLDELARIAQCGPTFTQSECRMNLALVAGGAAATLAASVGAKAAIRVRSMPKLCGLRGVSLQVFQPTSFVATLLQSFASSANAASCVDPSQEMARHLRQQFSEARSEIEDEIRRTGRERLKAEFPDLARNVDEQIRLEHQINARLGATNARDADSYGEWRAAQTAKMRKLKDEAHQMIGSLVVTNEGGRVVRREIDIWNDPKAKKLENAYKDLHVTRQFHSDPYGIMREQSVKAVTDRYSYEYSRSTDTIKKLGLLETEIATKTVSPERMAAMLDELAERAPAHQLGRLATLRQSVTERFKLPAPGAASRMAREGSKLIGKSGGKIGGGLLAAVTAGVAKANDSDGSVSYGAKVGEEFVGVAHLGCGTLPSEWATIDGDAGDCSYRPRWNAKTTDFVLQPEEVQRKELERFPRLCNVIEKVHSDMSASGLSVTCQAGGAVLRDDRRRFNMDVAFDSEGLVKRASVTGNGVYGSEYELQFSGDQFEKLRVPSLTGAVFSTAPRVFTEPKFKTTDITRAMLADGKTKEYEEVLAKAETHFAMMQPQIHAAQACCSGALESSDLRCAPVNRGKASTTGSGSNIDGRTIRK